MGGGGGEGGGGGGDFGRVGSLQCCFTTDNKKNPLPYAASEVVGGRGDVNDQGMDLLAEHTAEHAAEQRTLIWQ